MAATGSESINLTAKNDENMDEKKAFVTDKLSKRDEDRVADLNKRKEQRENAAAENESSEFFHEHFNTARRELEENLANSDSLEKSKLAPHFDSLIVSLQKMQAFIADSAMFLVPYDLQRANETLHKLHARVVERREALIPKKKFAFKSKKKAEKASTGPPKEEQKESKSKINVEITECSFSDISDETLTKLQEDINSKDVALARLQNCTVKFKGSPSAIHINGLRNCKVLSGPVSGSIFLEDCKECVFVIACQQLRVHTTSETQFYLHVTSRAIIEDSTKLVFAPYNLEYDGIEDHYESSGLDKSRNTWDDVDDFNWLASDARSPNWSIMNENSRQKKWNVND